MPLFVMVADLFGFSFLLLWVLQFDCLTHSTRRKLLHNDFRLMRSCGQLQYAYAYTTTAVVPGSRDQREQVRKVGAGCQRGNKDTSKATRVCNGAPHGQQVSGAAGAGLHHTVPAPVPLLADPLSFSIDCYYHTKSIY